MENTYSIYAWNNGKRLYSFYPYDNWSVENFFNVSSDGWIIFHSIEEATNSITIWQNTVKERTGISEDLKNKVIKRLEWYKNKIYINN